MNFKPNLWTLLFLIVAGALFYEVWDNDSKQVDSSSQNPECLCVSNLIDKYKIHPDTFTSQYNQYTNRCLNLLNSLNDTLGIVNMDIENFKLAEREIEQLFGYYLDNGRPEISVYPVVIKGQLGQKDTLDFVFHIAELNSSGNGSYFDFTSPCPTLCDTSQSRPLRSLQ